ncbi:hypothetical protein FOFC_11887 [Fusarium oxysporum]|nr:hypothetical protein FOFC_11887 [Fusarium oxysporum]
MPPRRACDTCYKRKIQCLIKTQGDPCDWCDSQGLTCTFDRVIQKDPNKRTTSDVVQELSRRVETLEEALQTALTNSTNMSVGGPSPWSEPTSLRFASSPITRQPGTLLLWASQKTRGQCREAAVSFASACRMVCDLGGHFPLSRPAIFPQHIPTFDDQTRLHLRRLFWICYCYDKDMSLRTDKPPLLTSDHCDISDAEDQTLWYSHPRDTNLARIKENASNILCSPRAFKYTEGELLAHVRQLDDELEEWRLSVDPRYRPRLSILSDLSFSLPAAMNLQDRTYLINLQLDYLFTIINIHTLVRKCGDLEENLPDDLHSVVHSSADLSIEASRSIFRILDTIVDLWKEDSLWIVSHYAPMAAMPLFMNILIHPLGSSADNDLHILSSISKITRKVPSDRLPMEEIEHIQEISEFVMELVRLSHSAAWKVKRGEREHDLDIIHT